MFFGEGGFVVEAGNTVKEGSERGLEGGVGAVGVGAHGVGRCGEPLVGDEGAVGECPVVSSFDVVYLGYWNVIVVYHVATYVSWCWLFLKEIATTRHAMAQGQC